MSVVISGDGTFVLTAFDTTKSVADKKRTEEDSTRLRQEIFGESDGTPVRSLSDSSDKGTQNNSDGNTKAEIAKKATEEIKKWLGRFGSNAKAVHIISDISEIPASEKAALRHIKGGAKVTAWVSNGVVYIYMPSIMESVGDDLQKTVDTLKAKVFHELLAHKHLKEWLGAKEWKKLMGNVWDMMTQEQKRKFAKYQYDNNMMQRGGAFEELSDEEQQSIMDDEKVQMGAADEFVAHFAEKKANDILDKAEQSIWQRIVEAFRKALEKIGLKGLTEQDLERILIVNYVHAMQSGNNTAENGNTVNDKEAYLSQVSDFLKTRLTTDQMRDFKDAFEEYAKEDGDYKMAARLALGDIKDEMQEALDDQIMDHVAEHYPTQASVTAVADREQYEMEKKAMKADPIYIENRRQYKEVEDTFDTMEKEMAEKFGRSENRFSVDSDKAYLEAVERGDMETAQRMVNEAAERAGYNVRSDYQGTSAFNGAAPSRNAYYESKEERMQAFENGDFEGDWTLEDSANGYDNGSIKDRIYGNEGNYIARNAERYKDNVLAQATLESRDALRKVIGGGETTIKMYRSIPGDIKEGSFRNGDWITPSRLYAEDNAEIHGFDKSRIIEQEVHISEVWWDGNDINEFGYDDGKGYLYKNTKNNRKLLAPVTYDDNGNVIPLSKRFDDRKNDVRFSVDDDNIQSATA